MSSQRRRLFGRRGLGSLARSRTSAQTFAAFYEQMSPTVLRYFARETRDPHRAFDLMSETFAKAFEKRRDFRGATDQQAAAWLWAIARTELARFRRSNAIELAALTRLGLERQVPGDEELRQVEQLMAFEQAQGHVVEALALLPPEQREVIELRFVEHLSHQEIAKRLGVSTEVVRSRSSRAMRTLRANDHVHEALSALEGSL